MLAKSQSLDDTAGKEKDVRPMLVCAVFNSFE